MQLGLALVIEKGATSGAMPAFMTTVPRGLSVCWRRRWPASAGMAETLMRVPPRSSTIRSAVIPRSGTTVMTTSVITDCCGHGLGLIKIDVAEVGVVVGPAVAC